MQLARRPLLAANWKLNHLSSEVKTYASVLRERLVYYKEKAPFGWPELCLFPVSVYGSLLRSSLDSEGLMDLSIGAQDVSQWQQGAHTGETSAAMLADLGFSMCIIGHSERRAAGETDAQVAEKLARLREAGITPVLCIGEGLELRQAGEAIRFTLGQLAGVSEQLATYQPGGFVIAYEPIWAIGTGKNAEPGDAQEMCGCIRGWFHNELGAAQSQGVRILYGGSVKPENITQYLMQADVDGALIGGASLAAEDFVRMAEACATLMNELQPPEY